MKRRIGQIVREEFIKSKYYDLCNDCGIEQPKDLLSEMKAIRNMDGNEGKGKEDVRRIKGEWKEKERN